MGGLGVSRGTGVSQFRENANPPFGPTVGQGCHVCPHRRVLSAFFVSTATTRRWNQTRLINGAPKNGAQHVNLTLAFPVFPSDWPGLASARVFLRAASVMPPRKRAVSQFNNANRA